MEYNKYVEEWQEALEKNGADIGSSGVDGKFGADTLAASLTQIGEAAEMEEVEEETEVVETVQETLEDETKETRIAVCTANTYVNVRDGRGEVYSEYEDIGNVYSGETVEVLDEDLSQEYVKIVWQDGVGYAYCAQGKYFKFIDEENLTTDEKVLAFLEVVKEIATPVEGENAKYIYGGEGNKITSSYVTARNKAHPKYFTNGRLEMLLGIAQACEEKDEWIYPVHYAWDCSGLWWYGANKTKLYGDKEVDSTAAGVYANYCDPVDKSELSAGDLVFYKSSSAGKITHMGVVGEGGVVYEAMSGYTGVVICDSVDDRTAVYLEGTHKAGQTYKRSAWTHFGRPKVFA